MKNTNNIGLDDKASQTTALELNDLLSNYQLFYMNLRGFHWNIKGKKFFYKPFRDLILKNSELPMDDQRKLLKSEFENKEVEWISKELLDSLPEEDNISEEEFYESLKEL